MGLFFHPRPMSLMGFLCVFFISAASNNNQTSLSVYEALQQYDFPVGLLPKGAKGYDLKPTTGEFSAFLNGTCSYKLDSSYELKYKSSVTGLISKGKLEKLSGVSVKVLLVWLNIVEVRRKGDELEFSVGVASADFPVNNFAECPQCGYGLGCAGGKGTKVKLNRSVHSS